GGGGGEPPAHAALLSRRIGPGTRNSAREPAMSAGERDRALAIGADLAREARESVLCLGEMGIANTSSATLLAHKITGLPLERLTGRGTGLDTAGLARKRAVLERAAARTETPLDAADALADYGGFEIAMMAGAMRGGAEAGKMILVDGFIAGAAALVALGLDPAIRPTLVFAHRSAESGHGALLDHLGAEPLLDLGLRLGEGTGALLAFPLLRAAAAMLRDMASFEDAAVSGPAP
ncbi:MAG: nicotinate-nucleotide--dimethylbenzimidazole phosphoribosyltransferase, partial [Alphaproteobacteria bacterium]|nr:nicotinate-nucleotide--dimethylbenzimidazole phosphoribosyltransferase [Alphaproteobacteria bacterium]